MLFLDTNAVIWLFQGELDKFSPALQARLEEEDLFISPMVKLELQYLHEVQRTQLRATEVIDYLYGQIGLTVHNVALNVLVEESLRHAWTRDPFDRLIVSHASVESAHLVTRDQVILEHYPKAIW